ncbi:MAG: zinc chelation protein SecC [Phormidesmis sp. RL_2_1]|nr:zinc chelation protein SecC [Phormidesmis sp. RL_2_1]
MAGLNEQCLCRSGRSHSACCGPYLTGEQLAPTAEALMRSRYSAFAQGNIDYLVKTRQVSGASADERRALASTIKNTRWLNLLIITTQKGQATDKTGMVEFVAAYQSIGSAIQTTLAGQTMQLHERSHFVRAGDRWLYSTGDILPPFQAKRSQMCWCGSGKKFKHCHG